jgi:hypothetical protein
MDIERILRSRQVKGSRAARPYENFFKLYSEIQIIEAIVTDPAKKADLLESTKWILEKHSVIILVTAFDVYFRDMLDAIFRLCKPQSFEPFLKEFHKAKYDIEELITIYKKQTHPCELVVDGCNFQNLNCISSVFSKLLGKSLWETAFSFRFRVKDKPETEASLDETNLHALQRTIALRHELIHNPDLTVTRCQS